MLSDGSVVASKTIADFLSLDRKREREGEEERIDRAELFNQVSY